MLIISAILVVILYEGDIPRDVVDARYSNHASQFMSLGDMGRIHFRDEGDRRKPTLVLLHGSNASLHTWEAWAEQLTDDYRVVSLDLPGHGLTGRVPNDDYSTDNYVAVVDAVLNELDVDQFVIAGNSMGGGVSLRYTLTHPDKVLGLGLINSGGLPRDETPVESSGESPIAFRLLRNPWFQKIATRIDPYLLVEQGLRSAYNHSPVVDDALIHRYYELNLRSGTREATILRFQQRWSRNDAADISLIDQPVLIMWGDKDTLIPFSQAKRFEEMLPQATTAYYEDVGHVPMEEIPEISASAMRQFLTSVYPTGN